jgi:hypothetical protein
MTATNGASGYRSATRANYGRRDRPDAMKILAELYAEFGDSKRGKASGQEEYDRLSDRDPDLCRENSRYISNNVWNNLTKQKERKRAKPTTAQRTAAKKAGDAEAMSMLTLGGVSLIDKLYCAHSSADLRKNGRKATALAPLIPKGKVVGDVFKTDAEFRAAVARL